MSLGPFPKRCDSLAYRGGHKPMSPSTFLPASRDHGIYSARRPPTSPNRCGERYASIPKVNQTNRIDRAIARHGELPCFLSSSMFSGRRYSRFRRPLKKRRRTSESPGNGPQNRSILGLPGIAPCCGPRGAFLLPAHELEPAASDRRADACEVVTPALTCPEPLLRMDAIWKARRERSW